MNYPDNPLADIVKGVIWPIKTVSVAMPDCQSTGMVRVTYRMGTASRGPSGLDGMEVQSWARMPDTYHNLLAMPDPQQLQAWVSELGWVLGSGYMYRWHSSPGRARAHLWGLERYTIYNTATGENTLLSEGDSDDRLADLALQYGVWQWEINASYRMGETDTRLFDKWREHDPSLRADGSREGPFPGWAAEHSWLRASEPDTDYESRYYYAKPEPYVPDRDVLVRSLITTRIVEGMSVAQAVEYAAGKGHGVNGRTLRLSLQRGDVPGASKIGRDWVIPYEWMDTYLGRRRGTR